MKPFNNTRIASATVAGIEFQQNESGAFKVLRDGVEITENRMEIVRPIARKFGLKVDAPGMLLVAKIIKSANA